MLQQPVGGRGRDPGAGGQLRDGQSEWAAVCPPAGQHLPAYSPATTAPARIPTTPRLRRARDRDRAVYDNQGLLGQLPHVLVLQGQRLRPGRETRHQQPDPPRRPQRLLTTRRDASNAGALQHRLATIGRFGERLILKMQLAVNRSGKTAEPDAPGRQLVSGHADRRPHSYRPCRACRGTSQNPRRAAAPPRHRCRDR